MAWSAECLRSKHKDQCHLQHPETLACNPSASLRSIFTSCVSSSFSVRPWLRKGRYWGRHLSTSDLHTFIHVRQDTHVHTYEHVHTDKKQRKRRSVVGGGMKCWSSKTCRLPVKCMRCAGGWRGMCRGPGELASCQSCAFCWCQSVVQVSVIHQVSPLKEISLCTRGLCQSQLA